MNSFVTPSFPERHQGADRLDSAIDLVQDSARNFSGTKGLVALLLAGVSSALIVVADQVVSTWADGQALLAWVALWALIFGAFALFSDAVRDLPELLTTRVESWKRREAQRALDAQTWAAATSDPRLMSELHAAYLRAESEALAAGQPAPQWPFDAPLARA